MEVNMTNYAKWDNAPRWANYHTVDEDGTGRWHESFPQTDTIWSNDLESEWFSDTNTDIEENDNYYQDMFKNNIHWNDTLEYSPNYTKLYLNN